MPFYKENKQVIYRICVFYTQRTHGYLVQGLRKCWGDGHFDLWYAESFPRPIHTLGISVSAMVACERDRDNFEAIPHQVSQLNSHVVTCHVESPSSFLDLSVRTAIHDHGSRKDYRGQGVIVLYVDHRPQGLSDTPLVSWALAVVEFKAS